MGQVIDMHDFVVSRMDWRSRFVMERGRDVWFKSEYIECPSLDSDECFDIAWGALEIADYVGGPETSDCVIMVEMNGDDLTLWFDLEMLKSFGLSVPFRALKAMSDSHGRVYEVTRFFAANKDLADSLSQKLRSA